MEGLIQELTAWLRRRGRSNEDSEELAVTAAERLLDRYAHLPWEQQRKLAFRIANNVLIDRARADKRRRRRESRPRVPVPGVPAHRFRDFIYSLGRVEAFELVAWSQGVPAEQTAAERRVTVDAAIRMRRRIITKWRKYLVANLSRLSPADRLAHDGYINGRPSPGDVC